jgi:phosphonoacetate hydrolase
MLNRRYFLFGSLAAAPLASLRAAPRRKILIILIDGFGPDYLERSDMPNLKRMGAAGTLRTGKAVIPSVTNVNNASLVTGSFPSEHGITTNFYYNRETKEAVEMESADFLLRPTLFERSAPLGWKTGLVTSKDKVRTLCGRGAQVVASAEKPTSEWIRAVGKQENMYTPEVNYWSFRAARHALAQGVDLLYLSTTDYMMHTYAPGQEQSLLHLHTLDKLLGDIVSDHPKLEVLLTADHGMNPKRTAIDPSKILAAKGIGSEAIAVIRDKHKVHHKDLGGACYLYLERSEDFRRAFDMLQAAPGVEEIYDARKAAELFHLRMDRIGDIILLAAKETAFGNLATVREDASVRSHGSRHEAAVPLLVYNRKVDPASLEYNLDLTRTLKLEDS